MVTQATATYAEMCTWENLYSAYRRAARGKRSRQAAAGFEFRLEDNLLELQVELLEHRYRPGPYASFTIHEPKRRLISAAPFRDRVVHHALCQLIEPAFERSFIEHSYANRVGKGTHRALGIGRRVSPGRGLHFVAGWVRPSGGRACRGARRIDHARPTVERIGLQDGRLAGPGIGVASAPAGACTW